VLAAALSHGRPASQIFETEIAMAKPVREWLATFPGVSTVADEIDAGYGVADLVAGEGTVEDLERRVNMVDGITNIHQLRLLLLANPTVSEARLRDWSPVAWSSLRVQALQPLLDGGHLEKDLTCGETVYRANIDIFDPFDSLIAVELKLKDWGRGIAQAARYRVFAERSYLAIPSRLIKHSAVCAARRNGIGLLAVHADSVDIVEDAPSRAPFHASKRRRASELMLQALADEQHPRAGSPRGKLIRT
jgi:hypothetical protein